jgi:non-ribosomal peptide synthetase component F
MPAGVTAQLQACAQQEGASLFMTLVTAVKALLHRYTGQEDMIVGAPIAGRTHKDAEPLVGLFVNMLALRTQFSSYDTFRRLLQKVKQTVTGAYAHQHYPFDELVRALNLEYDNRRAPLTDVWVQLTDAPITFDDKSDLQVTEYNPGYLTSKVDLTFKFTLHGEQLQVLLEYNTDLFRRETMEQLGQQLVCILQQLLDDETLPLHAVTLPASGKEAAEADDFLKSMYNLS